MVTKLDAGIITLSDAKDEILAKLENDPHNMQLIDALDDVGRAIAILTEYYNGSLTYNNK